MVATRSRKQPKEEEPVPETAAGGGIKAPARRVRGKKAEPETNEEEKAKTTSKKAAPKSRAKTAAKKEPAQEPEVGAREEEPSKVEAKKPVPRGRAKAAEKPEPEPEIKVTKRSTRAALSSVDAPEDNVAAPKTRKTSQFKAKAEATRTVAKVSEPEAKPKGRGRKPSASKKQTKKQDEKRLSIVEEQTAEGEVVATSSYQENGDASQAGPAVGNDAIPVISQSSKIPRTSAPHLQASPIKSSKLPSPAKSLQTSYGAMSPSRSVMRDSPPKFSASMSTFRSSVLSSPDKSLGSPRKPATQQKMLLSPAISRSGSPFRISQVEAPSVRRFNIQSPFKPPMLRPVASESQLSLSARKQALFAPTTAQRPSTSSGPSASASPTKSSMRMAGALSPKKSVTFHASAPAQPFETPATPKPMSFAQPAAQAAPTALLMLPPPTPKPQVFTGLTFVVDVRDHRTGADASGLFAPLLEELGARVAPTWGSSSDAVTHVLFKDGDLLTLEKVVAARGAVAAVNIGYALDCDRLAQRLDPAPYLIDLAAVPGLCSPAKAAAASPAAAGPAPPHSPACTPLRQTLAEIEFPTIAGLRIKTPSFAASKGAATATTPFVAGAMGSAALTMVDEEDKENVSPTPTNVGDTPLLQKSCPAKQEHKPLFALSTAKEGTMTPLKMKLMGAKRRETMVPRFGK